MKALESRLKALRLKQPAMAIELASAFQDLPLPSWKVEKSSPFTTFLPTSAIWFVDAKIIEEASSIKKWLMQSPLNHFVLLFETKQKALCFHLSDLGDLIFERRVYVLCADVDFDEYRLARELIWSLPGQEIQWLDPHERFKGFSPLILSIAFNKATTLQELMNYGYWNWSNIIRRLLNLADDRMMGSFLSFDNIPVILAGAGPSVDNQIESIRKWRNHFYIVAAGTGIKVLENHGLYPNLAMTLDPFRAQFSRFCLIDNFEQLHAAGWRSNYKALECLSGPRLLLKYSSAYPVVKKWEKELGFDSEPFDEGYNVVGRAISEFIGQKAASIYLTGVDLSFQNNLLYGGETTENEYYLKGFNTISEKPIEAKSSSGETINTLAKWITEAKWLEKIAYDYPGKLKKIGHKGLFLSGVEEVELEHIADRWPQRDYEGFSWFWQQQQIPLLDKANRSALELFGTFIDQLETAKATLEPILSKMKSCLLEESLDFDLGPSREFAEKEFPFLLSIEMEEYELAIESLELFPSLLKIWKLGYFSSIESFFENDDSPLKPWWKVWIFTKRIDFLLQGVLHLIRESNQAALGHEPCNEQV